MLEFGIPMSTFVLARLIHFEECKITARHGYKINIAPN
jgi:hypothetical protein